MAKPTLKPITLSTPPARANQGDLRREDQATAKVAGSTVSEKARPSQSANCVRAGSPRTPASTDAKSASIPKGEIMILAARRRPGSGAINARRVRQKPRRSRRREGLPRRYPRRVRLGSTAYDASACAFVLLILISSWRCWSGRHTRVEANRHRPSGVRSLDEVGNSEARTSGPPPCS